MFLLSHTLLGKGLVLLNDDVRVEVSPIGGKVVSFVDRKSGLEFVSAPGKESSPAGSGAFGDLIKLTRGSTGRELEDWEYLVVSTNSEEVVLLLKTAQLNLRKRIVLSGKSLTAAYELTNPLRRPFTGVFRSCSVLKSSGDGSGRLLIPKGIACADMTDEIASNGLLFNPNQPKVRNLIVKDPASGRLGWVSDEASLVLTAPFPVLDKLYVFMPDKSIQQSPQPTFEWYSDEFELKPYEELASYAEHHPECDRPEDLFTYRFSISIDLRPPGMSRDEVSKWVDKRQKDH